MCNTPRNLHALVATCLLAIVAALGLVALLPRPVGSQSPRDAVYGAWRLAQESGTYRFRSELSQTTTLAPSVRTAGSPPREEHMAIEGRVNLPAEELELTLWRGDGGNPGSGISIRVADGRSYGRQGQGEWQELDGASDMFAPGGDPLGFLAAARGFAPGQTETRELDGATLRFTRYAFHLDGPAFAEHMRARLADQLRARGELPPGITIQAADAYRRMTGQGILWVDDAGLPRRLELQITTPGPATEQIAATLASNFLDFDRSRLALATTRFADSPAAWLSYRMTHHAPALRDLALALALCLGTALMLLASVAFWRSRRFQTLFAVAVVASLVTTPLLQAERVSAAASALGERMAEQAAQQSRVAEQKGALAAARAPIDPHQSPLAAPAADLPAAASSSISTDTTDSDGDGLTDDEEASYGTCPQSGSTDTDCTGVANPGDTDADGIGDGIEVKTLGSDPDAADSDGDTISDFLEVNGFSFNNKTWYLNPVEADTNGDGLIDSVDCPVWSTGSATYSASGVCPDTDGDQTPNVWDDDDDGDGVLDAADLSPLTKGATYNDDTPLTLSVSNLQVNTPVFVDVQIRPTDSRQLSYISSMLDWPTADTEGQIQRRQDTTFASTDNLSLVSGESNAAYGDLRVVPLLEITMPGTTGHYANLPVTDTYQSAARPAGLELDGWLDTTKLDPYGITVRDVDTATGELAAYVPLSVTYDDISGGRVAYHARMLYWPSVAGSGGAADWGAAHEYRVIWLVQMLTDACIDATADEETCERQDEQEVIHIYRDESWVLSGLEVREDRGLDIALLYEDPAKDSDTATDDGLWAASWNLGNTFLRGRDCGTSTTSCTADGTRDVTVANAEMMLDSWSSNGDAIEARNFSYDHQGYLTQVMMTETPDLLADIFAGYSASVDPSILFVREETYRSLNLEALSSTTGALSFDLSTTNAPEVVWANLSWATYDYSDGAWANFDAEQYLDDLEQQLASQSYFTAADSSDDSVEEAEGKLIWAQAYYSSLLNGVSNPVVSDGTVLFTPSTDEISEISYSPSWPSNTFTGAGYVASSYLRLVTSLVDETVIGSTWQIIQRGFSGAGVTSGIQIKFKSYGVAFGNVLMATSTAMVVAGMTLVAYGYLSGDSALQKVGVILLGVTTTAISIAYGVSTAYTMAALYKSGTALSKLTPLASGAKGLKGAIGPAGLIIGAVIVWGLFAVQGLTSGLFANNQRDSIAVNSALAYAVAATIVLLIMFIIDMIPIVGSLIVLAIYVTDFFLGLFCKTTCHGGAQAWLTEVIADSLFQVENVLTNLDSPDRLDFDLTGVSFGSAEAGYTTANSASYTAAVTNTLTYASGLSDSEANDVTFRYYLQTSADDRHDELDRGQMQGEWQELSGRKLRATATANSGAVSFSQVGTGVNRDLGGRLYLTEAYVGLYSGCWLVLGIATDDCNFYEYSASNHIDIGSYIVYDILPADLSSLLLMGWNGGDAMPTPMDADGDGLVAGVYGGTDPSDEAWDSDGDQLSDEYELNNLLNAATTDSDGDGLSDLQEERLGFNALDADADNDGLSDSQERTGWKFGYVDQNGVQRYSWVWPAPYSADIDEDNLSDLEEFYYGFNPWVADDSDAVLNTITFSEGSLSESSAPLLLARFEEDAGTAIFADDSGDNRSITCAESAGTCPSAGGAGRFGNALSFDGSNDYLEIPASLSLSKFTQAVWIYPTSTDTGFHGVFGYDGGGTATRAPSIYYWNTRIQAGFGDGTSWNSIATNTGSITPNTWNHVAATYDGSSYKIYVNGAQAASSTLSKTPYAVTALRVGRLDNYFKGLIDEAALYDRALSSTEITALMGARYNVDDGTTTPGSSLTYNLTINNNSATWPVKATSYNELDGNDTTYSSITPMGEYRFEETGGASFADSSGRGYTATCTVCPTSVSTGYSGRGLQFDGVDDELVLDTASRAARNGDISFGGWVYPTSSKSSRYYELVFANLESGTGTTSSDLRGSILYDAEEKRFFGYITGGSATGSAPANQWHHVMITVETDSDVERLYLNGELVASSIYGESSTSSGRFRVGGPKTTYGSTNQYTLYPFAGTVDGVTLYNRRLSQAEIQQIMAGSTTLQEPTEQSSTVYSVAALGSSTLSRTISIPGTQPSGAYRSRQVVEAALDVTDETNSGSAAADPDTTLLARYDFDDPPGDSSISDSARRWGDGTCTGCPTLGIRGMVNRAAYFDGGDYVKATSSIRLENAYTIAAWVKARDGIILENPKAHYPFRLWTDRYDYGKYTGLYPQTYTYDEWELDYELPSTTEWHHVVVTYYTDWGTSTTIKMYIDGEYVVTPWPSSNSDSSNGYTLQIGQMLNGYLDDLRIYNRAFTADEAKTLYETSPPQLQLEFEEGSDATIFEDYSVNGYDATIVGAGPGLPGRIGTGGYFDGASGYAMIADAPELDSLTQSFTIMGWVKPSSLSDRQRFISSGRTATDNGFGFGMQDGNLQFNTFDVKEYDSTVALTKDTWQHVAVVFDANYDAKFYLNGTLAETVAGTAPALVNPDDPIYIGASTLQLSSSLAHRFQGKLDELFVYNRELGDAEIERAYYNQFRWFRKQHDAYLNVDSDSPTITVLNAEAAPWIGWQANEPAQIVVSTTDPSSKIWSFEYGVALPGSSTYTWQGAQRCAGSDESLWCLTFDPSTLSGEGHYNFKFRAVDAAGNETTSPFHITVDGTSPTAASSYSDTWLDLTPAAGGDLSWTVSLSGTVSDPSITGKFEDAFTIFMSEPSDITVSLVDATGAVAGKGAQAATRGNLDLFTAGFAWSLDYAFVGTRPSGVYTVRVSATDEAGNVGTADVGTIILDARPPSVEAETSAIPEEIIDAGTVIKGVLADQPSPAGDVTRLHFEETSGDSFADYSGNGNAATCTNCPTSTAGVFGLALAFSKASSTSLTVPYTTSLDLGAATFSAWVMPTWATNTSDYNPGILGVRGPGEARLSWHIRDDYSAIDLWNGSTVESLPITMTPGEWHHLALVQEGSQWTGYLDGVALGTVSQSFGGATGLPLTIGASGSGSDFFTGAIDEVIVFERALSAQEIYALAQSEVSGAASVEMSLTPFNPAAGAGTPSWQSLTLAQSAAGLTTWSYAIPSGLESFYQVQMRGTDAKGNATPESVVWSGAIDTQAPRLTASAQQRYGGTLAVTEYTLSAEDLFLDTSSIALPCVFTPATSTDTTFGRVNVATATCSQMGHTSAPVTVEVCDYALNCTSQSVTPSVATGEPGITIATPATSVFTGTAPITLGGLAYAGGGIQSITLSANGSLVETLSYPAAPTETNWEITWTPQAPGSYTLTATVTAADGSASAVRALTLNRDKAPGGVDANLSLWLRADAGLGVGAEGAAVSNWVDQAQGWAAQNSSDTAPTLSLEALNFNPALSFGADGASELNLGANFITADAGDGGLTVFAVADPRDSNPQEADFSYYGMRDMLLDAGNFSGQGLGIMHSHVDLNAYYPKSDTGGFPATRWGDTLIAHAPSSAGAPAVLTYGIVFGIGGSMRVNGAAEHSVVNTVLTNLSMNNVAYSATRTATSGPLTLGRIARTASEFENNYFYYSGDLAEVIIYKGSLTDAQRAQVEAYLALKYGLTLAAGQSYVASSGATVWDAVTNAAYHNDVAGIGRDDTAGLSQPTSRGVNADAILTIGAASALSADHTFLMWGNDDGALDARREAAAAGPRERLGRAWRFAETGETGDLTVSFDLAGLGLSRDDAQLALLIDDDGDFADATVHTTGRSVSGDVVGFSGVDVDSGQYLSLRLRQLPEIAVTNTIAPTGAHSGDVVTYTVALRNTGLVTATGVALSLPLPAALSDAAVAFALDPGVALTPVTGQTLAWSIGDLPPGASGTITVTATISAELNTTVAVTATISADDDYEQANNTATASLTVGNRAPTIAAIADTSVAEGTELRFTAVGSDSDLPAQALLYSLADAPTGAVIDPITGVFTWTPTGDQGPGSYPFTVGVSDGVLSTGEELTVTVRDQDLTYGVTVSDASVSEGQSVTFTVTRSGATDEASTVAYQLGGSATAGSDYGGSSSGTLQFAAETMSTSVTVTTLDDQIAEGSETLSMVLMNGTEPSGGPVAYSPATADVQITDDDLAEVMLSAAAMTLKPGTSQEVKITLRSQPTAQVWVNFSSDTPGVCSMSPTTVVLDGMTWQAGASVTITATNAGACIVSGTVASNDQNYDRNQMAPLHVTVREDEWRVYLPLTMR